MKKFKYLIIIFALAFTMTTVNNINADDVDYKKSGYVISQEEADKMIAEHGKLIQSSNDKAPEGYRYFMGYDPVTHDALWTNKVSIQSRAVVTKSIKTTGTWKVGSYWGEIMQDSNGDPVYCGTYGANYPVGSFKYIIEESTKVRRALSWGYKRVTTSGTNSSDYGKTQLALWKGQGKNSVSASTLGVYQKVADAYKGNIGLNLKSFDTAKSGTQRVLDGINQSNGYKVSGTASYKFTTTQLNKVKNKGADIYLYQVSSKKWIKAKANTNYDTSKYSHVRIGTKDMSKAVTINNIEITANVPKIAGYIWKIENSGYQDIFTLKMTDPVTTYDLDFTLKAQTGDIKVLKMMDDIDLYEQEINISGQEYYKTKDGKPVMFKTELGELSVAEKLRYPTKEIFEENNLYGNTYEYSYLDYENVKELVVDENGVNPNEDGYIETYADVIDSETGYPVVEAKKDGDDYVYATATTEFNMPSKAVMDNEYKAQKDDNVEFTLYKADKKTVLKKAIVDKGELEFNKLLPGTYYVKESKTKENFNLINTWYKADVAVGKTTTINNGKSIVNEINFSELYISKTDATGEIELDGAQMQLLDSDDNVVEEWISKAGDPHYVKVSKGIYYIKETIAPEGRVLLTTLIPVNVDENGQVLHVKVKNEIIERDLEISKTDVTGEKELNGANMCLYNTDTKEKIECWTSTKTAKKFKLTYGNYYIVEKIAPKGYLKLETTIPVIINENGKVMKIKVKNEAIKYVRTGGINYNPLEQVNKLYSFENALN